MKVETSWDRQKELPGQRQEVGPPGTFEKLQVVRQARGETEKGWQVCVLLGAAGARVRLSSELPALGPREIRWG